MKIQIQEKISLTCVDSRSVCFPEEIIRLKGIYLYLTLEIVLEQGNDRQRPFVNIEKHPAFDIKNNISWVVDTNSLIIHGFA